jgi:type IV pilus assembly protein PilE
MICTQGTPRSASSGFTLIELMIVVAIVAILASVALPAYHDYIRRGQLPEAFSALSDYRVKLEQYYQDHRNYGAGACADGAPVPAWSGFKPQKFFDLGCSLSDGGQKYTLTATGARGRTAGHVYILDQDNQQATLVFKGGASVKACWPSRGSEC